MSNSDPVPSKEEVSQQPAWENATKPWKDYPIGTIARESWNGFKWTKTKNGWKAWGGDTFTRPGGSDQVLIR